MSATSSLVYTTASNATSGGGCEFGCHPMILFDSATMATTFTAPTNVTADSIDAESGGNSFAISSAVADGTATNLVNNVRLSSKATISHKNGLPANIRDELKRCIALKCMSIVFGKPIMKQKDMFKFYFHLYHGNKDNGTMSQLDLLIMGYEPYAGLYNLHNNVPVATGNGTILIQQKVVKHDYLAFSSTIVIAGVDITRSVLEKSTFYKPDLITGWYLHVSAKNAMCVIKKALAQLENLPEVDMITASHDIVYHSSKNEMDAKERFLSAMYIKLKGKPFLENKDPKVNGNDNIDSDEDKVNDTFDLAGSSTDGSRFYYLVPSPHNNSVYTS
jgi:hypothetical protein